MKTNRLKPKLSDSQKNSSSAIEDVMAELRNLKLLVDEAGAPSALISNRRRISTKETAIASIRLIKKSWKRDSSSFQDFFLLGIFP